MKFWLDDPTLLFNTNYIKELWPYEGMDFNQKMNAITRLIIILTLFGFMCFNHHIIFILGFILIGIVIYIHQSQPKQEGMSNYYNISDIKNIEKNNPMGNVLISDYKYNPYKSPVPSEYNPVVEKNINEKMKQMILEQNKDNKDAPKLFSNMSDNFNFEQSLQRFYTNPVTTIDQKNEYGNYLNFIYGTLPSNKPLMIY